MKNLPENSPPLLLETEITKILLAIAKITQKAIFKNFSKEVYKNELR